MAFPCFANGSCFVPANQHGTIAMKIKTNFSRARREQAVASAIDNPPS
jgi:hypothetical protein